MVHSSLRRRDRPLLRLGFDSVGALIYQARLAQMMDRDWLLAGLVG